MLFLYTERLSSMENHFLSARSRAVNRRTRRRRSRETGQRSRDTPGMTKTPATEAGRALKISGVSRTTRGKAQSARPSQRLSWVEGGSLTSRDTTRTDSAARSAREIASTNALVVSMPEETPCGDFDRRCRLSRRSGSFRSVAAPGTRPSTWDRRGWIKCAVHATFQGR